MMERIFSSSKSYVLLHVLAIYFLAFVPGRLPGRNPAENPTVTFISYRNVCFIYNIKTCKVPESQTQNMRIKTLVTQTNRI
jgi:hypothetical protein